MKTADTNIDITMNPNKLVKNCLKHLTLASAFALCLGLAAGTSLAAPANDDFANAIDLTGAGAGQTGSVTTGDQTGTNSVAATVEVGEPSILLATKTVWFKWTSPGDGAFTISTLGSTNAGATEWDSMIGIYTGAAVNALTPVSGSGNNPQDTGVPESKTVTVTPGITYYFQLAGHKDVEAANILLNWNFVATVYQADILTYGPGAVIGTVVANAANIAWTVPFGSNLATLAPTFSLSVGATATLDGNPAVSGATVDFSGGPKNYVVTSQGASIINTYTVTATPAPPPTDGTWITDGNGNWSDPANWDLGKIADGLDKTAFLNKDITTATRVVTLDAPRTIGNITFTDSTTSSHDLTISGANILTLDVTTGIPLIDVTQTNRTLTIGTVVTGSDGLQKNGIGILAFTGTNTYTGTTVVNDGILNFGITNIDGIGGGAGSRDISVTANKIVQRTHSVLNAAFMKRLVETSDEFAVCSNASAGVDVGTGNILDFSSSSSGANLPNAFFGSFATNGGQCRYNGTIIPASDNYRIGFTGTNGALSMIQPLVDVGTPRGLIIGGATPVLVADNTFTGDTVLRSGRLFLGRQLALQNSALNVGNGVDGNTGQICFLASNVGGATQGQLTNAPTLGGLIGSRHLRAIADGGIYNNANQNNTTRLAVTAVLGLTLDVDNGKTHTYSGNARMATGMFLTKTGPGTQVLSGTNDYTGATSVNEGTLALVGGSQTSAITVASGASLDFTLGSPTTSTKSVDLTNGTVKITGSVDNASDYTLMTASNIVGTPTLGSPIANYTLQKTTGDTVLKLVYAPSGTAYETWAGLGVTFDADANGDGVKNGLAFLLGAASPSENAIGRLPIVTVSGGGLVLTFNCLPVAARGTAALKVSRSNTLTAWTSTVDVVPDTDDAVPDNDVTFVVGAGPAGQPTLNTVTATISSGAAAAGKLFGRLEATQP